MLLLSASKLPCKMRGFASRGKCCCRSLLPSSTPRSPSAPRIAKARSATSTTWAISLLIVATDRISAFDYVLGSGIPDKGKVLTQISAFWFERTRRSCRIT